MERKTFIIYNDRIDYLDKMGSEEKIEFIESLLKYQNGEYVNPTTGFKFIRPRIKNQMDLDKVKWEEERVKRSIAGKTGGLASANKRKQAKPSNRGQSSTTVDDTQAIQADTVTVTDTVKQIPSYEGDEKSSEEEYGYSGINKIISKCKKHILGAGLIYDSKDERNFAKHFFSKKYKTEILDPLSQRFEKDVGVEEAIDVFFDIMSNPKFFWSGKISSLKQLYQHSAKILNSFSTFNDE